MPTDTLAAPGRVPKPSQLQAWKSCLPSRLAIKEFLDWCEENSKLLDRPDLFERYLDEYFEIDQGQLDDERRAVLAGTSFAHAGPGPDFKPVAGVPFEGCYCQVCVRERYRLMQTQTAGAT